MFIEIFEKTHHTWWSFIGVWMKVSLQVCRAPRSILANLDNSELWIVSTRPVISKSSSPCNNPLVTVPRAPITIGNTFTFMFHIFFQFPSKKEILILLFAFFQFYSVVCWDSKVHNSTNSFTFFCWLSWGLVIWPRLGDPFVSQNPRSLCVSFSRTDSGFYIYHLFVWSNLNFLHNSHWITIPTQACLVLCSFWANLLHSIIMWWIISSQSLQNLYFLFYCVISILALIWLVLIALFYASIKRDSTSLLRVPFLNHVYFFSSEKSLFSRLKCP